MPITHLLLRATRIRRNQRKRFGLDDPVAAANVAPVSRIADVQLYQPTQMDLTKRCDAL